MFIGMILNGLPGNESRQFRTMTEMDTAAAFPQ